MTANMNVARAEEMKLMVFGDSLVAGYNLSLDKAYPKILENKLKEQGYNLRVVNRGISGDTTSGGLARLRWTLNQEKPDLFILELGANDMLRATSPSLTKNNLDEIIRIVKEEYNIPVMVMGMYADPALGEDFTNAYIDMYKEIASKHDVILYPFFLDGVANNKDLLLPDHVHPNEKGVEVLVERTMSYVTRFLDDNKIDRVKK